MSSPSSSKATRDDNELLPASFKRPRLDGQKQYKNVYPTREDSRSSAAAKSTTWTVKLSLPPAKQFRLGSMYTSPEAAARASDHALIAIYGLKAATPFLNFSPSDYFTTTQQQQQQYQQLFGPHLTMYLQALGKAPNGQVAQSFQEEEDDEVDDGDDEEEAEEHPREQEHDGEDHSNRKPCGMCPACRLPWTTDTKCLQLNINSSRSHDTLAKARQKSLANRSKKAKLKAKQTSSSSSSSPVVKWVGQPVKLTAATVAHKAALRLEQGKAEQLQQQQQQQQQQPTASLLPTEAEAEVADTIQTTTAATTATNTTTTNQIALMNKALHSSDIYPPLPYTTLIQRAKDGHVSDAELCLIPEDDPVRWVQPPTSKTQCPICKGFHSSRTTTTGSKCPVLEAAYAVVVKSNKQQCKYCFVNKVPGCSKCRGKVATLPDHLTIPSEMRIKWKGSSGSGDYDGDGDEDRQKREGEEGERGTGGLDVRPSTLEVMDAVKQVANAAVVDLNAPHLAGKLSPDVLLVVGLIAESLGKKLVGRKLD